MSKKSDQKRGIDRGNKERSILDPVGNQRDAVAKAQAEIATAIGMPPDDIEIKVYYWE